MIKNFNSDMNNWVKYVFFVISVIGLDVICPENSMSNFGIAQDVDSKLQTTSETVPSSPLAIQAKELLSEARQVYNSRTVVVAQMSEDVLIMGQRIVGMGTYKEKIDDNKRFLRMDMSYSTENSKFSIRYIADGDKDLFWIVKNMEDSQEVLRVDLFKLTELTANPDMVASVNGVPIKPISLGGIPYMLSQLEHCYLFNNYSMETNVKTGEKYHVIEGVWNPKQFPLPQFVSKDGVINWDDVSAEIPDCVKVYFDERTLFPSRVHYYRTIKGKTTLITKINYYNVSFNVRLMSKQFAFEPQADVQPKDFTDNYLKNNENKEDDR